MAVTWSYGRRERFAESRGRECKACGKGGLVSRKNCGGNFFNVYNIDHLIPESRGGTDDDGNLRLLCMSCNVLKSDMAESEFQVRAKLKREVEHMIAKIANISDLAPEELTVIFSSVNIGRQHRVLTEITKSIVSMPEADYGKYA